MQESGKQFVTVENSMGIVHTSYGTLKPAGNNQKAGRIVASLIHCFLECGRWMVVSMITLDTL